MILLTAMLLAASDYSKPKDVQPYIESLKEKYDLKPPPTAPIPSPSTSSKEKTENLSDPRQVEPYIEKLRKEKGVEPKTADTSVQPYIESLKKGKDLEPKYKKVVDQAAGIGFVTIDHFDVSSKDAQANAFDTVYNLSAPGKYNPSIDLFYERQLFRDRYIGSVGPVFHLGLITAAGKGVFTKSGVRNEDTKFHFYAIPISAGGSYRANQLRFVVPFVQASLMAIPYLENRDDGKDTLHGYSKAFSANFGVSFNLDWISRKNAWAQYDSNAIIHTYFMVQYQLIRTFASVVQFNYNGLYAGLLFEF